MNVAFVAGATGYVGRAVVRGLRERGARVLAHVRPDSQALSEWRERFGALGAEVDTTPWVEERLAARLRELSPTCLFALLGTTRARAKRDAHATYERVDLGLTVMLLGAARTVTPPPRFVYLSSVGVDPRGPAPKNAYLAVRWRAERAIAESGVPFVVARPSFITGPDRDESRAGERVAAAVTDAALSIAGAVGARRLRDRYASTDASTLAQALVRAALDPAAEGRALEGADLR